MSAPPVSVVIACFNYGHCLPESIGSVLAQTLTDLELLVIDDGSTDDSLAVAQRLAAGDPRVTVIAQENAGQPAIPRNRAIERARGRYIVSLDADDKLGPTVLERCVAVLEADPEAGLAYPQEQNFGGSDRLHPHLDWSLERLTRCNFLPSATMFRRAAWEAAGGYHTNVRGYEDWDLWLGVAEAGYTGRPAHGALWYYRKHDGGVYSESKGGDQELKAHVVVNRSGVFGDGVLTWAHGVLAGDAAALAVPQQTAIVPDLPDPPRPLVVARDRAERADWYVDVDDLASPFPGRTIEEALAFVDGLGYTAVVAPGAAQRGSAGTACAPSDAARGGTADPRPATGAHVVARRRGRDPRPCPVPFLRGPVDDAARAAVLGEAISELLLVGALREPGAFRAGPTARHVGVDADALPGLLAEAQDLMASGGAVPPQDAAPLERLAGLLRTASALGGDGVAAARAGRLERAARRAGLEDARGTAVLAFGGELVAAPELLAAYGAAVSQTDDATLVIVTGDADALVGAIGAAGLDGDGSPDMLAVGAVPRGADAVLSRHPHGDLPRFDETSAGALRALLAA